jgi:hypothetical protein
VLWSLIVAMLTAATASAQSLTSPAQLPDSVKNFGPGRAHGEIPCAVEILEPALNFGSRFQAGYVARIPLHAYSGGGHLYVVFEVTPKEGNRQPVLFADTIDLPDDRPDATEEVHGAFQLGEGNYHVKWSIMDDVGRVFRKQWDLDAKPKGHEKIAMPPATAGDLSWRPASEPSVSAYPRRVTVLLSAAPMAGYPWTTMLGTLAPLVERLSRASIRLVVLSLPLQRELFEIEGFGLDGMNRVVHATNRLIDPAADHSIPQHQAGVWELLAGLVNREVQAPQPVDAVIFVGAPWWIQEEMPVSFPKAGKVLEPRFFSLHYPRLGYIPRGGVVGGAGSLGGHLPIGDGPPMEVTQAQNLGPSTRDLDLSSLFDTIKKTVLRMRGKIFNLEQPADFNRALEEISRRQN